MAVIDASALIELLLRTTRGAMIGRRVLGGGETLYAPALIDLEAIQVLRRYARARVLSPQRAQEAMDDLTAFPIKRVAHENLLARIWQLRDSMSAYDACYVALAEAIDRSVVTCDAGLARAQGHGAKVELFA
jgi:predicted nucleic acid-binding protein